MARLGVDLLGGFLLAVDGEAVELSTRKAKALLAVISLDPGRPWPRPKLAAMLWGRSGEGHARTSLRQTLSLIRKAVPEDRVPWLRADGDAIALNAESAAVDVATFERLAGLADADALDRAAGLYQGDLLDGLDLNEEGFEEWLGAERGRLRERAMNVLARLAAHHIEAGTHDAGIDIAGRLLTLDPLREDAHRTLMVLYGRAGRTDAALRQFQTCREVLARELAVQPAAETQELHDAIHEHRLAPKHSDPSPGAAGPARPLPARPSVAVLPFDNLSGDPDQAYFSDGITEDVITELARNHALFVISRKSSFAYRDSNTPRHRIAQELGVRYLLEGSVRRAGGRVRITAQLTEAATGNHIWAERYDRQLDDVFAVQEEVARIIVATLAGRLDAAAETSARAKPTGDLGAYDFVLRAQYRMQRYTREDYAEARGMLEKAILRDPGFARAYGLLALVHVYEWFWQMSGPGCAQAIELGLKALELDDHEARGHVALSVARTFSGQLDRARYHIDRAIELNPNDDLALVEKGRLWMYLGDPEGGAQFVHEAKRLNPYHPNWYWNILGRNLHTAARFEEAIAAFKRITTPTFWVHAYLAACAACLGRAQEAERHRAETLRLRPDFTISAFAEVLPYADPEVRAVFLDTLRRAGLPG